MSLVRFATITLLCSVTSVLPSAAQQPAPFLSLADLLRGAPRLTSRRVVVRCHYAQGKQGPTVYDDDHRTVFPVLWSVQIINTAQYLELITATETDWLVLTGELDREKNFIIYDGQFDSTPHVTIKIINAKTNRPITDEKLNVALRENQIGSVAMATDKNGVIDITTGTATIILILFEIPRTFIPSYPKPPLSPVPPVPVAPESLLRSAPHSLITEVLCSTPS